MNLSVAVKIPEVGESISEVAIGEWLKHEGDFVERDEDVVVIETDKATVEVPAPEAGRVDEDSQKRRRYSVGERGHRLHRQQPIE